MILYFVQECLSTDNEYTTVALGSPEVVGHPKDPIYDNQDRLTVLMREITDISKSSSWRRTTSRDPGSHTA